MVGGTLATAIPEQAATALRLRIVRHKACPRLRPPGGARRAGSLDPAHGRLPRPPRPGGTPTVAATAAR